ncbi:RNA polymerase sigma factor [Chitinophaga sp. Cy-1792]|uniref:RNA polymerase sigma factor n=1 Tax=Chitinophaga sp. Cy-1792 TaxID=2608339 RepID=UPI0014248D83|nr:sigma-70 family RNA polymerase sigma factor [Chitinophaga sp. Cy-1792]NIG57147.1 sigma-70 family RNA polymerase sigma factor [Chitinophaga sp. Cy-1792]
MKTKEAIFLKLIEQHKGIIHKISRMYMDNSTDQEDLAQEIIYQLWKSFDNFRSESSFSTWMYRVALNTALVFFKKDQRLPKTTDQVPEIAAEETGSTKESQLSHFYRAVQKLDRLEKALIFYHLEQYSHKEIADNLGITEGNARTKLSRAKIKLKELIKLQGYEF